MCGLFTYLNYNVNRERTDILQVLFNGLRRLEYRGYDSTGIAIDNSTSDPFTSSSTCSSQPLLNSLPHSPPPLVFRQEGNIESLVESVCQGNKKFSLFVSLSDDVLPLCLVAEKNNKIILVWIPTTSSEFGSG